MMEAEIKVMDNYRLVPFFGASTDKFYVYVGDVMVASVQRNENGSWSALNDSAGDQHESILVAAFADANLSNPDDWS
jgi:hypothetical protein